MKLISTKLKSYFSIYKYYNNMLIILVNNNFLLTSYLMQTLFTILSITNELGLEKLWPIIFKGL